MSNICERLVTSCISADCNNPIFQGAESIGYLFNKSQIASVTTDPSNPNIITAITMGEDSDEVAYTGVKISQLGKTPFTGTSTELVEGNVSNKFTETVQFVVPDNSPASALILDAIANGKFVVIVPNEYEGSDSKGRFQVYGLKRGLTCSAMSRNVYDDDTDSAWSVTLSCEGTPTSALFVHHETTPGTDDTREYLESLVSCE